MEMSMLSTDKSTIEDEKFDKPGLHTKCFKQFKLPNRESTNFIT